MSAQSSSNLASFDFNNGQKELWMIKVNMMETLDDFKFEYNEHIFEALS